MRGRLLLALLVGTSCTDTDGGEPVRKKKADPSEMLSTRWASSSTPSDFVAMTEAEIERLMGSMKDGRRGARVELAGRRAKKGMSGGSVFVSTAEYPDLESTRGLSMRMIAEATKARTVGEAQAKGVTVRGVEMSDVPDSGAIELRWTLRGGPASTTLEQRSQMGLRDDGVLLEAGCTCTGSGCAEMDCTFSLPTTRLLPREARFESPRSPDEVERLDTQWASSEVPKVYVPLSIAEEQGLPSRSAPAMKVEFEARRHELGGSEGLMWVRSVDYDPEYAYGQNLRALVEHLRQARLLTEAELPEDVRFAFSVNEVPAEQAIELHARLPEDGPRRTQRRSRFVLLSDGTLREGDCYCDDHVCDVEQCTLDLGDADRAPLGEAVFPGGEARTVSLAKGGVRFQVPPFFEAEAADDATAARAVEQQAQLYAFEQRCFEAPKALGSACIKHRVWCSKGECTVADIVRDVEADLSMLADELGRKGMSVEPAIDRATRMQVVNGSRNETRELVARIGSTIWQKTIVSTTDDGIVERTCECSGTPCAFIRETCTIADP